MLNKIILLNILFFLSISSVFAATNVGKITKMNGIEYSCPGANAQDSLYILGESSGPFYMKDNFLYRSSNLAQIIPSETQVSYYIPDAGVVEFENGGNINNTFTVQSWVAPKDQPVRAISSQYGFTFYKPSNPANNKIQLVYNIAYKGETGYAAGNQKSDYFYYPVSSMNDFSGNISYTEISDKRKRTWGDVKIHENECYTLTLSWCGDGKKNGPETCDPNDLTKSGWGAGGCTATCQPNNVVAPKCSNLTYSRDNNMYDFTCTSDKAGATKFDLFVNGVLRTTNATGVFNNISLTNTDDVECRVENEAANLVSNSCKYNDIGGALACTSLTATPNTGVGQKDFTSVGVGAGKHELWKNSSFLTEKSGGSSQVFSNIDTVNNDQFRNFIVNSRGNRATADTCTFLVTDTPSSTACTSLTYARNDNSFNFTCSASGTPAEYFLYNANGNLIDRNTTGRFTTNITDVNADSVYCRVTGESITAPSCSLENVLTRMACSNLGVDNSVGAGVKIFTSTATADTGVMVNRHTLSLAGNNVGDSGNQTVNTLSWVFNNINAQVNNQFRATVFDNTGNSATGNSCVRTITDIPPPGGSTQCLSLSATPNSGSSPLSTSFTCSGDNVVYYKINIYSPSDATSVIHTINSATGSYTFVGDGNYKVQCFLNDSQITSTACTTNIVVGGTTSSSSGGGSSGGGSSSGGSSSGGGGGYCGNGRIDTGETCETHTWVDRICTRSDGTTYVCASDLQPVSQPLGVACRNNCTYCGDGKLDDPIEQCDLNQPWCNNSCSIDSTWPGGSSSGGGTTPGGGTIELYPSGNLLIGHGMSVFGNVSPILNRAYIKNNAPGDIYIPEKLCVQQIDANDVLTGNNICTSQPIGRLNQGNSKSISLVGANINGTIQNLGGDTFGDAQVITKVQGVPNNSFLNGILNVRVAKPSINTAGGGAGLIKTTSNISDVNIISNFGPLNPEMNRNLILTSLGLTPLSSNVGKQITGQKVANAIIQENQVKQNLQKTTSGPISEISNVNDFEKYNGLNNVFIHKGNVRLASANVPVNRTYIIDGDLYIDGNIITPSKSVLFVVKGTIYIKEDVEKINAVLMAESIESEESLKILNVKGALYGDISGLLENRTYVKNNGDYVDVGTNVSFSSDILANPPPLLSKFLSDFVNGGKIAK